MSNDVAPDLLRRIGKRVLAAFIGLTLSLLLAECSLRIIGIGSPVFHRPDATYGLVLIPGADGWFVSEGKAFVTINGDGFRDVSHARNKPPDTVRIAVLGDSYAEALQVPLDQAFWRVLGKELATCDALHGRKVEILNFGVSGYSTAQEYLLLQKRVWGYQPDVVLLAFLTGNDVADNHPDLGAAAAPFYRFEADQLVLDSRRAHSLGTGGRAALWLVRHSRVFQLANQVRLNLGACGKLGGCAEDRDITKGEAGLRNGVYLEPTDDRWKEAWRVTEELLRRVRDEVAGHGARFLLVTLSNGIQVHPDPAVRAQFRTEIGAPDLLYPDHRLEAFAQRENMSSLALAPVLAAVAEKNQKFLHGFAKPNLGKGHWNADGHRLAAQTLSPWVCKNLAAVP
jgi:hypothetical protein